MSSSWQICEPFARMTLQAADGDQLIIRQRAGDDSIAICAESAGHADVINLEFSADDLRDLRDFLNERLPA